MNCAGCGRENRAGAKFCGGCGKPLAPRCRACGGENQPGSQFCDACGASLLAPQAEAAEARKVVTIVFADLIGSTALHERLDAESARRLMDRYHRSMGAVVEAHGGTVMQLLGDGVLAGFGVPRVAEDDAIRAVRAAVGMQQSFRALVAEQAELAGDIGLRVAVNTGEVVAGDDHTHVMGDPVNVAARLQQEARDGDVLLGESTQRLVGEKVTLAPFGSFALKGRAEPVAAYRVLSLERPAGAAAIAFVGREDELRRIRAVYDTAVSTRAARLAVILGSPGLGKSRLIDEFTRRLGAGTTVLMAHCDAAGEATFAPLAEALRGLLRIDDGTGGDALRAAILARLPEGEPERARIADGVVALVAGMPASPEEIFFVVRRGLAAVASARPVVLAIDDVQWAEPLLLDLIEHLVQWGSDVPLLVLAAARPELRDARSSLATPGGLVSDVVTLAGLDAGAATRLAANVIGAEALPAAIAGRVLATSEGNPLFVGELVRMLVHDGALKREGDRWTAGVEVADLEMPPTIHALLAARIERLRPEERTVLERAAVIGRHFSRTALTQLLPREVGDLDARLESLRRSELVEPDTGWFLGEPVLRFHHVLIRDAAYRRLLKNTRAELHGRFADWLEARAAGSVEHDETLGWHLEQAHQHLRELGPIDAQGRALGERAARHLAAAGRRALARDDLTPAASLLERALARLDSDDPARADLALDWCEAVLSAGDVGTAARAISELGRFTADSDRLRAWHTCFGGQLAVFTDPKALRASAASVEAAAVTLTTAGDAAGEAKAHSVHALVLAQLGKIGACEAALDKALAAARRARDRRRANAVLAGAPVAALWGPSPVTRASGRCLDVVRVLRITQGAPAVEAVALRCQAVLETLRGRAEAARRMIASSRHMVEELGITQRVLEADLFAGLIELLEGDAAAAERCLRVAYDGLRAQGLGIDAAQAAALLGRALIAQGRIAEAEAISIESESLAGDSFKAAIAWRGVRAEALAARGEHAAAIEFARAAVEIAAATDDLLDHADARQALAVALRAAGRSAEAGAEEKRAIELWEAKGATLLAERAGRSGSGAASERPREAPARLVAFAGRRVRPNAATAHSARLDAAVAARDLGAIRARFTDEAEAVHHPTGAVFRERGNRQFELLLQTKDLVFSHEPLATLGDCLALCRGTVAFSAGPGEFSSFGASEMLSIVLNQVDAQGRCVRIEFFATDRLGDAIAHLYELYAELLPDGSERTRAAATARSVAVLMDPPDLDRHATVFAPSIAWADYRTVGLGVVHGAGAVLRGMRAFFERTEDIAARVDDILDLRSDALLVRRPDSGSLRAGGGAYERQLVVLWVFGTEGLLSRWEQFDADRDAEARARFDELTATPKSERRVRPNAASANAARAEAAIAARDADAWDSLFADEMEGVIHPSGARYDRQGVLGDWRSLMKARDGTYRIESLATLGDSLALSRLLVSASGVHGRMFDVGPYERQDLMLIEVGADSRRRRSEIFGADRLGDAVARLYERYAEILPDGPERTRAAATARSFAASALVGAFDPVDTERLRTALAPDLVHVDRRTAGLGSTPGAEAFVRGVDALLRLSDDFSMRIDDVLDLRSNLVLVRVTTSGTDRASGGAFDRPFLLLLAFGSDGLVSRWEQFDVEGVAEALARFDELTAVAAPTRLLGRGVRPNAAITAMERYGAAFAARDADLLSALFADDFGSVEHTTGAVVGRADALASLHAMLRSSGPSLRYEPLAALGESLSLVRRWWSSEATRGKHFDVAASETEEIVVCEADETGCFRRGEIYSPGHLGDAIVRLYERYAELLPDGPERTRAAATARSVAVILGPYDTDLYAQAHALDIEYFDHRTHGVGSLTGVESVRRWFGSLLEVADGVANRFEDVRSLRSDALLLRWTNFGTERAGGGSYERHFLWLGVFGTDGLLTRLELFEGDRDAEALARFDELTGDPLRSERRVRANAATANAARLDAVMAERDADSLPALLADDAVTLHHPSGTSYDRRATLAAWGPLLGAQGLRFQNAPLATLGDSLALCRRVVSFGALARGNVDSGATELEEIALTEVDAQGRRRWAEFFAPDHLGDAIVRLYERHADFLPEGPAHERAAATARSAAAMLGSPDLARLAQAFAPAIESVDHRILGTWSARGAEALLQHYRSLLEVAGDIAMHKYEILCLGPDALLVRRTHGGTDRASGGAYERPVLMLLAFGTDGRIERLESFDPDRDGEALAHFDELAAEPPAPAVHIENAATRQNDRVSEAWAARDWKRLTELFPAGFRYSDRKRMTQIGELDRGRYLEWMRPLFEMSSSRLVQVVLATRGDRLVLSRLRVEVADHNIGPSEIPSLAVIEVDEHGERVATVRFDLDDLDAAYAELDARYAASEAAPHARVTAGMREFMRAFTERDWDAIAARCAPELVVHDRRLLGWETLHGPAAYVEALRSLVELAPDTKLRLDHAEICAHGYLVVTVWEGTREGGAYEAPSLMVAALDGDSRIARFDQYDLERLDQARARFAELRPDPLRIPPNAAARASDRSQQILEAHDWDALARLTAPTMVMDDRRRGIRITGDRDTYLASTRMVAGTLRMSRTLLATAGDRVALQRVLWTGEVDGAAIETEILSILEIDAEDRILAIIAFDPDDRRAASAELLARDPHSDAVKRAMSDHDLDRLRAALPHDFVLNDHRRTGLGQLGKDEYLTSLAALFEQAPDVILEPLYTVAAEEHANLSVVHMYGTLVDGGAFESVMLRLASFRGGQIVGLEFFEPEDLDAARARFAELRPDPLRIPPNAATRAGDRWVECIATEDWDALRALCAPIVFEDRRRLNRTTGGCDMVVANSQVIAELGARASRSVLATSGDRLALERILWTADDQGAASEVEVLQILEVDAEGRVVASIVFDPDGRRAASAELLARDPHGDAIKSAMNDHDLVRLRSALPDDFVFDDHRRTGLGKIEGAADYIDSLAVLFEQAPDVMMETLCTVAVEEHGNLSKARRFGTLADGGAFDSVFVRLASFRGGRLIGVEMFELEDLDAARARFEALRS